VKKAVYAVLGALLILSATALNRFAGGGVDLVLLMVLGLALLIASADVPTTLKQHSRDGP
jgi:ABC-type nickel/cobalt efflux system permease component RcnA